MWGFYPDECNPHRVGFSVRPVAGEPFTYWIEPGWMADYARAVVAGRHACPVLPAPSPPRHLTVPVGFGAPDDWDDDRHAAAKLECWMLTSQGWAMSRARLLRGE